jgi:Cu/Zn superoxide dismutase
MFRSLSVLLLLSGCQLTTDEIARAQLNENGVVGEAVFQDVLDTKHTSYAINISSAPPGVHGVQLRAPPCGEETEHFNPDGVAHGAHRGDLGNLTIADDGTGNLREQDFARFVVADGSAANDVVGRVIVILEGADDLVTEPDGNAGAVLACARVEYSD